VAGPDLARSPLGDGIANASFELTPGVPKQGPIHDPTPNGYHEMEPNPYLSSASFCGSCHDVRLSQPDAVTGEPFTRLENAFSEWQRGPYATSDNPYGQVITCQDCHMSAYPYQPPGSYFQAEVANYPEDAPIRRVSTHYFTGVDRALVDFPGQDDDRLDQHGLPIGQAQRRIDLLQAACRVELELPAAVTSGSLPIVVAVTNVGAGHNVPTGFSQERQIWIELTVSDRAGAPLYRSGHLEDSAHPETGESEPDGLLHDEDLLDFVGPIDPDTFEADVHHGPDHNERPRANRGLVNFGNQFWRSGNPAEEVFIPFIADVMDNGHSIPPLTTLRPRYDVAVPAGTQGPLTIVARLRFRAFPPRFLRMLAVGRPDLVDEALVDRNVIVEMAQAGATIAVSP
jgi:hypothetical protein